MLMLLSVHVTSAGGKFCPDYGLLLELHALTLVARSYALLVYINLLVSGRDDPYSPKLSTVYHSPCSNATGLTDLTSLEREEQSDLVFYPPLEILMETAILTPSGNGTTPIEAVFSSLSPLFDSDSMCLYVSNMPMNYTAQQLLKLFQTRYPSAYKAEMFKVIARTSCAGCQDTFRVMWFVDCS